MTKETTNEKTTQARALPWLAGGSVLLLLSGLISFGIYQHMSKVHGVHADAINRLHQEAQDNTAAIESLQKTVQDLQSSMREANDTLSGQQNLMNDLRSTQQSKKIVWQITEAQYLTKLANTHLQIGDNLSLVIQLLKTAQEELTAVPDQGLVPLRQSLEKDMMALQAVPAVDVSSLYMRLVALSGEVDNLPVITPKALALPQEEAEAAKGTWWQRELHGSWQNFKELVVVRHQEGDQVAFVTPDQAIYLKQNIHGLLTQSMTALLQNDPVVYQASLQQAASWTTRYFVQDAAQTKTVLSQLQELQAVTLRPTLPTLNASLQAFHDYLQPS